MSKLTYAIGVVLLLNACTSSEQVTQTETHTIPPVVIDTTQDGGGYVFYGPSPCDTARILAAYCKGYVEGQNYGISYGIGYETRVDTLVKKDTLYVVRTVPVIRTNIVRDTIRITDLDTVKVVQVEEYGFWDKVGLVLTTIGVIVVLGFLAWVASRFGLKLPI